MNASELAQLAASLAHGRTIDRESARALVNQARTLLEAAQSSIDLNAKHRAESESARREQEKDAPQIPVTPKADLPGGGISLRRFLRSLEFKTEGDGLPFYRQYLEASGVPSLDVEKVVKRDRTQGIRTENFPSAATQFARWLIEKRAENFRTRASEGGKAKSKSSAENKGSKKVA